MNKFASHTYQHCIHETNKSNYTSKIKNNDRKWNPSKNFLHHKLRIQKLCRQKEKCYEFYFQDNAEIYKTIIKELFKLEYFNSISLLCLISNLRKRKNKTRFQDRRNRKNRFKRDKHTLSNNPTPSHSNITTKWAYKHFSALNIDHEI